MKKRIMKVIAATALFATMMCSSVFAADPTVCVILNGYDNRYTVEYSDATKEVDMPILLFVNGDVISDANAVIKNGTTLVPLRVVSKRLGAEVRWNPTTRSVDITKGYTNIQMTIGNRNILVNGEPRQISNAPEIINSLAYVPLRAVATAFEVNISYFNQMFEYYNNGVRIVVVDDGTTPVNISLEEAMDIATNAYFYDCLYDSRDYILQNWYVDVYDVNPYNFYDIFEKDYSMRYYADFGRYYYLELFDMGVEYALVDKYDGTCYPVSAYSMIEFQISSPYDYSGWTWYFQ